MDKEGQVSLFWQLITSIYFYRVDREGKKEMTHLLKYWTTMRSQDFLDLKQKLGV
ncbi:hypothetical protein B0H16DRAFT_1535076 [Mycena metata]|uniref:Uncharacterized protein n=1 Tax=Mycena metata TaxID=1033252 RepID=A0AAD7NG25_9AGAR|nr:hypothetical protein B0H16DRAFT_1535076 [Mycena metata]